MDLKWQKGTLIVILVVLMIVLFYAAGAFAHDFANNGLGLFNDNDNEKYYQPKKYVSDVSPSQYLYLQDLYMPKRFQAGEYHINFPKSGKYFFTYAGGPGFQGGTWTFSQLNGTIVDEQWLDACGTCLAFGGGGGFEFEGGELEFKLDMDDLELLFLDSYIAEEYMYESKFPVNFSEDVFAFNVPFDLTNDPSGNELLTAKINKMNGKFSALFFDEYFFLIAEVHDVSETHILIPSGGSYSVFVVLLAQGGGDFNVEFYYSPAIFAGLPFILLISLIFIAIVFVTLKLNKLLKKSKEKSLQNIP